MPSVVRRIEDVLDGLVRIDAGQVGGNHSMSKSNDEIVRIANAWNGVQQHRVGKSMEKTYSSGWLQYRISS